MLDSVHQCSASLSVDDHEGVGSRRGTAEATSSDCRTATVDRIDSRVDCFGTREALDAILASAARRALAAG
jgi:hypothetical protein